MRALSEQIAARTRELVDQAVRENRDPRTAVALIEGEVGRTFGYLTEQSQTGELVESVNDRGFATLSEDRVPVRDLSSSFLRDLAESLSIADTHSSSKMDHKVLESTGIGVDPTVHANISAYNVAVSGMIKAAVMERYDNPDYIGRQMVTVRPTDQVEEKMIATAGIPKDTGDPIREPNMPHARAMIGDRFMQTPPTVEHALAIDITQEMIFFDKTGQVIDEASQVGDYLAYREDLRIGKTVLGITNNYNYKNTDYNTYLTSGSWINDIENPVGSTEEALDTAKNLWIDMLDPETGRIIRPNANNLSLYIDESKERAWQRLFNATEVRETSGSVTTIAGRSGLATSQLKTWTNPEWRQLIVDAGLANATQAKEWWVVGDFKKAFLVNQNWGLRVREASASEYGMIDRGIARSFFANMRTVECVKEPRYAIRNKHTS